MAKGYNVGTFTSPYIECFNERIAFNTKPIDDDDLLKMLNIHIKQETNSLVELIFSYIKTTFELRKIKIFIFVLNQLAH